MSAAVIILRRKKFIRRFEERRATSPEKAIAFADVGMRRSWIFDQMVGRGVFVRVAHDRYYMNEPAAQDFLAAQRRWAVIVTGVLLLLCLIIFLASMRW